MNVETLKFKALTLAMLVVLTGSMLVMPACNVAQFVQQFDQYTNDIVPGLQAVIAILEALGIAVPVIAIPNVKADVAAAQTLVADFATAPASAQPQIRAQIAAEEAVLNQDLQCVFVLAAIKDPAKQAHIQELIQLIESAVQFGFNAIPQTTSKDNMKALAKAGMTASQFRPSFNQVLTASWGDRALDKVAKRHQIPSHSLVAKAKRSVVHAVTFGKK